MLKTPRMPPRPWGARFLAASMIGVLSLAVLAGFGGRALHALDSVGHFRAHLAALLGVAAAAAFLLRAWLPAVLGLAVALSGLATTYPFLWPAAETGSALGIDGPRYTLLQMNLRYDADPALAIRRIAAVAPDVVTVQEGTDAWRETLAALRQRYPHQFFCDGPSGVGDSGILSRRPFTGGDEGLCLPDQGFAARSVDFNGVAVTVASLHLDWPWPYRQWAQIAALQALPFDGLLPLILAGDFNAAPWSAAVGTLAQASRTVPVPGIGPTWLDRTLPERLAPLIGLPIDNVLVSEGVELLRSERMARTASDHLPVLVTFTLRPPSSASEVQVVRREPDVSR